MEKEITRKKNLVKKLLLAGFIIVLIGACLMWYLFTKGFADTATLSADYTVNAREFINEFKQNDSAANKKYSEKVIIVNGRISSVEAADTVLNLRMDESGGSYVIFAFQAGETGSLRKLKAGDSVSVKGSCSNGSYSDILQSEFIAFKRCSLNNK